MKNISKLNLVAVALLGALFYSSCRKNSEPIQQDTNSTEKVLKSPFANEIRSVEINESGIATIKTSNGQSFRKNVSASFSKRKLLLSKAGISTDTTTIVDIIPMFPTVKSASRSSISSSESIREEISSTWTLTYVRLGGIWTVTIWPAVQWISDYQVSATIYDVYQTSSSISFRIQYVYTRNGAAFYSNNVPHSRNFY